MFSYLNKRVSISLGGLSLNRSVKVKLISQLFNPLSTRTRCTWSTKKWGDEVVTCIRKRLISFTTQIVRYEQRTLSSTKFMSVLSGLFDQSEKSIGMQVSAAIMVESGI